MRVLITGSSGYIGKNLSQLLSDKDLQVVNISRSNGYNLLDWDAIKNLKKCEVIFHLAAHTYVPDSFNNPKEYYTNNIVATINILELARLWGARVIYLGSYCYGRPDYIPVDEKHSIKPHNPYSQSKWISEELCAAYSRDFDMSIITFRLFNVYGPQQSGSFLISEILNNIRISKKVILKDPRPKRDYIHINDVTMALYRALQMKTTGFHVFNLGTGMSLSVERVVEIIRQAAPVKFEITYTNEYRKGEVLESVADISKLIDFFDWRPTIQFEEGVKSLF